MDQCCYYIKRYLDQSSNQALFKVWLSQEIAETQSAKLSALLLRLQQEYAQQPWYRRLRYQLTTPLTKVYQLALCQDLYWCLNEWEKAKQSQVGLQDLFQKMKQTEHQFSLFSLLRWRLFYYRLTYSKKLKIGGKTHMISARDTNTIKTAKEELKILLQNRVKVLGEFGNASVKAFGFTHNQIALNLGLSGDKQKDLQIKHDLEKQLVGDGQYKWLGRANKIRPRASERKVVYYHLWKKLLLEYVSYLDKPFNEINDQLNNIQSELHDLLIEMLLLSEYSPNARLWKQANDFAKELKEFSEKWRRNENKEALPPQINPALHAGLQMQIPSFSKPTGTVESVMNRLKKISFRKSAVEVKKEPLSSQLLLSYRQTTYQQEEKWQNRLEKHGECMLQTLEQYHKSVLNLKVTQDILNELDTLNKLLVEYFLSRSEDEFTQKKYTLDEKINNFKDKLDEMQNKNKTPENSEALNLQGEDKFDTKVTLKVEADNPTWGQITKKFKELALENHPDKNPGDQEKAEKFMQISNIYHRLEERYKSGQLQHNGNIDRDQEAFWEEMIQYSKKYKEKLAAYDEILEKKIKEIEEQDKLEEQLKQELASVNKILERNRLKKMASESKGANETAEPEKNNFRPK